MKRTFTFILSIIIITSCNYNNETKKNSIIPKNEENKKLLSLEIPTNHINAWMDKCGFSFELNTDTMWAMGEHNIRYKRLNDSLFEVYYPENYRILDDIRIENYDGGRFISFSNSGLGCCVDKTKNEIYFGADRLFFKIINANTIKVFYPQKSIWKISRISEREIYIYNEKNKIKYTEFTD